MAGPTIAYTQLIADHNLTREAVVKLLNNGYYAVPVGAGEDGKGWLLSGRDTWMSKPNGSEPPDLHDVLEFFDRFPGCGVSVAVPHLRGRTDYLVALDVDVDDDATMTTVAFILGRECPVKVGSRGATFFARRRHSIDMLDLCQRRRLPAWKGLSAQKIGIPRFTEHKKRMGIDLLDNRHTLLPPSMHIKANRPYRWVPFPGSSMTLSLEDVPAGDLPMLEDYHYLLLYQWAKNPETALWAYLGNSAQGDHHDLMLAATMFMWHEMFEEDEIVLICEIEAARTADDQRAFEQRQKEIRTAVAECKRKAPDRKPSVLPSGGKERSAAIDRLMFNWLIEEYKLEDCAQFGTDQYWWNGHNWHPMIDRRATDPWLNVRAKLRDQFPQVGRAALSATMQEFEASIPARVVEPDPDLIAFENGVLNIRTCEMRDMRHNDHIITTFPFPFDVEATCPTYDMFSWDLMRPPSEHSKPDTLEQEHLRAVETLEEFLGYCMARSHAFRTMLFLVGPTTTGKSTLYKLIRMLFPKPWVSTVPMHMLNEPNALPAMVNSHINCSAEIGRQARDVDDLILKVTSGEEVPVKILYKDTFQLVLGARLFFYGNLPPETSDSTGALERRMIILRTSDTPIPEDAVIPDFENILIKEAPGILLRWVAGYGRLLQRGHFQPPTYSATEATQVTQESNSVSAWFHAMCEPVDNLKDGAESTQLYTNYAEWCQQMGFSRGQMAVTRWGKVLTAMGYPSLNRKTGSGMVLRCRKVKLVNPAMQGMREY